MDCQAGNIGLAEPIDHQYIDIDRARQVPAGGCQGFSIGRNGVILSETKYLAAREVDRSIWRLSRAGAMIETWYAD